MEHAPIKTAITDKLASGPWIRWFRLLVDRLASIEATAVAPAWEAITGKPATFPPSEHTHPQYLTEETDPTVPAHVKSITEAMLAAWDKAARGEFDWIDFNTALASIPTVVGRMFWDPTHETPSIYLPNGVTLNIGQEMHTPRSKNTSGATILNGQVVYIKGASGNAPEVGLANASTIATSKVVAIATTDVPNNNHGVFTTQGYVHDIDTDVIGWDEGDELFLDTTDGGITNTPPVKGNSVVSLGYLIRKHATQGSILVSIRRQPTLEELDADDNESTRDAKGRTGFADPKGTIQSYDPVARTVTTTHPSGTVQMWFRGRKLPPKTSPWVTPAHGSTLGTNWFFYSVDGEVFSWSNSAWDFSDVIVAYVRYGTALKFGLRECHGQLDPDAHRVLHNAVGTRVDSGGNLTAGTYAIGGTASDASNTPGCDSAELFDEDLETTVPALAQGSYEVVYPSGTGEFALSTSQPFPFTVTPGGYINWFSGSTPTQGATTKFYCVYGVVMPSMADAASQKLRWIWIAPQAEYATLAAAQGASFDTLDVGEIALGITEYVPRVRLIYGANASYMSTGKVRLEEIRYLSRSGSMASAAASAAVSGSGIPGELAVWVGTQSLGSLPKSVIYNQATPATTWGPFSHPYGRPVAVETIDSLGNEFDAGVEQDHPDYTTVTIQIGAATTGRVIIH